MSGTAQHIVLHPKNGPMRKPLIQPPHFRTGQVPAASPTPAERQAVAALKCSEFARLESAFRFGSTKATVHTPKPTKVQAKKIRQVLEHHAGHSFND